MPSAVIGSLRAVLGIETAQFETGLQKARGGLNSFGRELSNFKVGRGVKSALAELEGGFKATAGQAGIVGSALSSMGLAGVGAAAALGGLGIALSKAKDALAFADEIGDTAAKLAISTDALQEYRFAIRRLGGEFKDADTALAGFASTLGAAQSGLSAKAVKPFSALGLDPQKLGDTETALRTVIDRVSKLSSTAEQAAIADKLGLGPLLPLLRAGNGEFDRLIKAQHDLGIELDRSVIDKAGEAQDRLEDLDALVKVQLTASMVELAPTLVEVAKAFASVASAVASAVRFIDQYRTSAGAAAEIQFGAGVRAQLGLRDTADGTVPTTAGIAKTFGLVKTIVPAQKPAGKPKAKAAKAASTEPDPGVLALVDSLSAGAEIADRYATTIEKRNQRIATDMAALRKSYELGAIDAAEFLDLQARIYAEPLDLVAPDKMPAVLDAVKGYSENVQDAAVKMRDEFRDALNQVGGSFDQLFYGLKNKNWMSAASGLLNALSAIRNASGVGGKIGAAAGAADAIGQAIGGTAGAALGGAASGAMLGLQFGGPVGAAVGAVVGLVGGILGGSSAKKKAEAEAKAKAAQEAAAKAAQIAAQKRELELQIMEAQGKAEEALAARRSDALAAMDEGNRSLQQQLWDIQDAKAAADADAATKAEAAQKAEDDLAAAREAVSAAAEQETGRLAGIRDQFKGFAESLSAFARSLTTAAGGGGRSYRILAAELERVGNLAGLGNVEALGQLEDVAKSFLDSSKSNARNSLEAARDQAKVRVFLQRAAETATRQADLAQSQLDGINATVAGLGLVNNSVQSLGAALTTLAGSLVAKAAGGGRSLGNNPGVNAILAAATGYTGDFGSGGFQEFILGASSETQAAARAVLTTMGQPGRIMGFASGGAFRVGGPGGVDSVLAQMRVSPSEWVAVSRVDPIQTAAVTAGNINAMREQSIRQTLAIRRLTRAYDRAQRAGMPVRALDPSQPITVAVA